MLNVCVALFALARLQVRQRVNREFGKARQGNRVCVLKMELPG